MIVAVLSDVHGNREALEAVLREVDRARVQEMWYLGDLVGYNPDPDFCVTEVVGRASRLVRGNHDKACAGLLSTQWFNTVAREALVWTRRTAQPRTLQSIERLPAGPVEAADGFVLCHGTPFDEDAYMVEPGAIAGSARWMQQRQGARVCFHGHTHTPFACRLGTPPGERKRASSAGLEELPPEAEIVLEPGSVYLINPGSVGQPRDGNSLASFGILDTARSVYRTCRVPYDVQETQRKIIAAGLPRELAWRLPQGR